MVSSSVSLELNIRITEEAVGSSPHQMKHATVKTSSEVAASSTPAHELSQIHPITSDHDEELLAERVPEI